ncbi:MMPL family transporter [archaeon]|jgi:preprotein translocase subunit SecF|nr:MMPL family transporter [archaeon]MBT4397421.1 MMPL family transporter [archaeon]MBT4440493.1 MMPL family transporter [archaeon]
MKEKFREFYLKNYKKLFIIPIIILIIALITLGVQYAQTGDIIEKDVSLKGGITATIYTSEEFPDLESQLQDTFPGKDLIVRDISKFGSDELLGISIEISDVEQEELREAIETLTGITLDSDNFSIEIVGSSLGENFYKQMMIAILLAFLFMAIVVFITFRMWIPSLAVVFAAFADLSITMAILNLANIRLSTAGIAALLLLIGYSIDTDILLTTRILKKREGTIFEGIMSSMKTGLTMSITTIVALSVGYLVATSLVLKQMFLIIIIGLLVDIIITYCMNAGLLVWYAKRKRGLE